MRRDPRRARMERMREPSGIAATPVHPCAAQRHRRSSVLRLTARYGGATLPGIIRWVALEWGCMVGGRIRRPAEGKIIASSHSQGQVLIELDPTQAVADQGNLAAQLAAARAEAARNAAETAPDPLKAFAPPPGLPEDVVARNRRLLSEEVETQRAKLAGLASDIQKAQADLAAGRTTVDKLERTLPLLRQRVEAKAELAREHLVSQLDQFDLEQKLVEMEQDLITSRHRVDQAQAAIESARQQRAQAAADFLRNAMSQAQEAEKKVATLTQDLAKAASRTGQQTLTAPVAGTVQELSVHTEGGVVSPADTLLSIVPDQSGLEIEAKLLNRDVGFVVEGQEAEIKLDPFQYTKYGTIHGTVTWVSRDAVPDDKLGLLYPVRVSLAKTTLDVGSRQVALGPGMSASVEIKTETRRVIEYLLSSLQRYQHEAMRER